MKIPKIKELTNTHLLMFAFVLTILNFIIRIWWPTGKNFSNLQFGYFPGYIVFFIAGVIAYENNWFLNFNDSMGMLWFKISGVLILLLPVVMIFGGSVKDLSPFMGGICWQSMVYSMWEAFTGTGLITGFFVIFRRKMDFQNDITKFLSDNVYSAYIIHALVIIFYAYALKDIYMHPLIKFVFVSVTGVSLCFLISHFLARKIPYLKKIL
ncbi:acyltransferase family protein [Candidatus Desantisbacteria bacterium]|nr:acyltransferase family protein [Candidatus Desantisbacteria bacterium]